MRFFFGPFLYFLILRIYIWDVDFRLQLDMIDPLSIPSTVFFGNISVTDTLRTHGTSSLQEFFFGSSGRPIEWLLQDFKKVVST